MSRKTLSVSAIENGCVIDHIPAGQAGHIISLLHLNEQSDPMTVGMNLPSKSLGLKDILKIENRRFTEAELSQIAVFAAGATVNEIENFEVMKKFKLSLPESIIGAMHCPNSNCITHQEPVPSQFTVSPYGEHKLKCHFCESSYPMKTLYQQYSLEQHTN